MVAIIIISIGIILTIIITMEKHYDNSNKVLKIAYSMLLGGGVSNLIDRLIKGYVVDFIDITEIVDYPIFNIADIFIVIGIVMVIINSVKELQYKH